MSALLSRTQIGLAALCLALAALFVFEQNAEPAAAEVPVLRWQPAAPAPLALAPALPPSDSFAAIDERPLFNPARKPVQPAPDAAAAAAAPPPPPSNVSLIGIIIDGERRIAMLRTPASPLAISVAVGQDVGGWQVSAIEPGRVVLHSGTSDFVLDLNARRPSDGSAPPSDTPAPPPTDTPSTQVPNSTDGKNP